MQETEIVDALLEEAFAVGDNRRSSASREITHAEDGTLLLQTDPHAFAWPILEDYGFEAVAQPKENSVLYARQSRRDEPIWLLFISWESMPSDPRGWVSLKTRDTAPLSYVQGHPHGTGA